MSDYADLLASRRARLKAKAAIDRVAAEAPRWAVVVDFAGLGGEVARAGGFAILPVSLS